MAFLRAASRASHCFCFSWAVVFLTIPEILDKVLDFLGLVGADADAAAVVVASVLEACSVLGSAGKAATSLVVTGRRFLYCSAMCEEEYIVGGTAAAAAAAARDGNSFRPRSSGFSSSSIIMNPCCSLLLLACKNPPPACCSAKRCCCCCCSRLCVAAYCSCRDTGCSLTEGCPTNNEFKSCCAICCIMSVRPCAVEAAAPAELSVMPLAS
mmetsp:Transcript_8888/g.21951  ORF Transcript_8888/g.21951 Transcript_8888/m.21951 type:complete len:211 (+) Transcript_8888:1373-2005(+)